MKNIAVFASGTGSNFIAIYEAIVNQYLEANIVLLVSDRPKSSVVKKAIKLHIPTFIFNPSDFSDKASYEIDILNILKERDVDLIVLAGYMRLIGNTLLNGYQRKIINIHPSLLPQYKGLDAIGQAMNDNAKMTGITVHYVDKGMDTGDIIAQESFVIEANESRETIEAKAHNIEHQLYPKVIKKILEDL